MQVQKSNELEFNQLLSKYKYSKYHNCFLFSLVFQLLTYFKLDLNQILKATASFFFKKKNTNND